MKNILILITLLMLTISCEDKMLEFEASEPMDVTSAVQEHTEKSNSVFERAGKMYLAGDISVSCSTKPCDGNNIGSTTHCQVGTNSKGRFECTCSGCEMKIILDRYQSDIDIWEQIYAEDLHLDDLTQLIQAKHHQTITNYNKILFQFHPTTTTITYEYELSDGSIETVMYANKYTNTNAIDKSFAIDCSGACGCREIFDFNTNKAECSCDPCKLTITVLD